MMYFALAFLGAYIVFVAGYFMGLAEAESPVSVHEPRHLKLQVIEGVKMDQEKFRPFGKRDDDG